jgi:hypothetical protein
LVPGHKPSQEVKCLTLAKRDMSAPTSETVRADRILTTRAD